MRQRFEGMLFNIMFSFSLENKLINLKQSRFTPGDSYINQLLSITDEILKSFDE